MWRSVTFRLALIYVLVFGASVTLLLGFIYWSTAGYMEQQTEATIEAEIRGLAERYRLTSLDGLVRSIDDRIERNPFSSTIYLLTNSRYARVAGNLDRWPTAPADADGWLEFTLEQVGGSGERHQARARSFVLAGDFHLLVGRDMFELRATQALIARTLAWGVAITAMLAFAGAVMMSRSTAKRLETINATSRRIMRGDLSQRIPTRGTHDEFDQLAANLNGMLDQIQQLMDGVRHVSDNIAHDLKTPLTRLRNRAEEALRAGKGEGDYRAALEATIEESDELIRTFNALLMIARAESGQASTPMTEFDAAEIAHGVGELYDPLADEKGLTLKVEAETALTVRGNRELVTQALANLVDNAIKYAGPERASANGAPAEVVVQASADGDRIRLSVSDHGPGIPAPDRVHVVERFVRLEESRSEPGSGLGLSLASAVAHLHGGALALEDNHPGLKATLLLPRAGLQVPQPAP